MPSDLELAAEIERLKEQVEALTQLVGQLDLRLAAIEGKPLHVSDRSEMVPLPYKAE